jgi:hypothetical protein
MHNKGIEGQDIVLPAAYFIHGDEIVEEGVTNGKSDLSSPRGNF